MKEEYKSIAAYEQEDFRDAINRLVAEPSFLQLLETLCHYLLHDQMSAQQLAILMKQTQNIDDFDDKITFPALHSLADHTTRGMELQGKEHLTRNTLFITNHRDIILDAAFLSVLVKEVLGERFYMGVGTNLYVTPWIEDLVRLHKCFNIIRGGGPRELMAHSTLLSSYIHYLIVERHSSAWIAQREGRAKDSNDRTQAALLKMLTMAGEGSFIERLQQLHITPVALCYEYDPCDYLKAKEMQLKRDNADYKKTPEDDYLNMRTGIVGQKGKLVFTLTPCIDQELAAIGLETSIRNEQADKAAALIDKHIHSHYAIFTNNKIAYDLLFNDNRFKNDYTEEEKREFEKYLDGQIDKIDIPMRDDSFLRERLLEMYANPLRNKISATEDWKK